MFRHEVLTDILSPHELSYVNVVAMDIAKVWDLCLEVLEFTIDVFGQAQNPRTFYGAQHPLAPFVIPTNFFGFFHYAMSHPVAQSWVYHNPGVRIVSPKLWLVWNAAPIMHDTVFSTFWVSSTEFDLQQYLRIRTFLRGRYGYHRRNGLVLVHVLMSPTLLDSPFQEEIVEGIEDFSP